MSKKALANAERVADEAISILSRFADCMKIHIEQVSHTYPDSFDNERQLVAKIDEEVKRLRCELEGQG